LIISLLTKKLYQPGIPKVYDIVAYCFIDNSIKKMDNIMLQLEKYQEYITNTDSNNNTKLNNIPDENILDNILDNTLLLNTKVLSNTLEKNAIQNESPEYYESEANKFLTDVCKEKEKRIQLFNKILNLSMAINIILLAYILGIQYYNPM
jgi:hypothetical protein